MNCRAIVKAVAALMLLLVAWSVQAQGISEEARRHMVRGRTAIEMAKTRDDLNFAIKEFEQVVQLAPDWADGYFNLGSVQEKVGDTTAAIANFKHYLELAPTAEDAPKVRDKIIALEYMQERTTQLAALSGNWGLLKVSVQGDHFTAEGAFRPAAVQVFFLGLGSPTQQMSRLPDVVHRFDGQIAGNTIKGVVTRETYIEGKSGCQIPAERSEFTGHLDNDGTTMTLEFPRTEYRADWNGVFWGLEDCTGVSKQEVKPAKLVVQREADLPKGGLGIRLKAEEGTPSTFTIVEVMAGTPAAQAGMLAGDRLVQVNGADVTGRKLAEIVSLLRGEPGTTVALRVVRTGEAAPRDFIVTRADLTEVVPKAPLAAKKGVSATSSACFIATAAYGTPTEEHVAALRVFRDQHLLTNGPGRWFVAKYYEQSPPIADYIREREELRGLVRGILTPVVFAVRSPWLALIVVVSLAGGALLLLRRRRSRHQVTAISTVVTGN